MAMIWEDKLPSGLTYVGRALPDSPAVAIGVFIRRGSRDDYPNCEGLAHLVEHAMFHGSKNLAAGEIMARIERVGGSIDASTARDYTAFTLIVPKNAKHVAMEILCEMLTEPLFPIQEMEKEKQVMLSELKGIKDQPDDMAWQSCLSALYPDMNIGRSICGTEESLMAINLSDAKDFWSRAYQAPEIVISAAGSISEDEIKQWAVNLEKACARDKKKLSINRSGLQQKNIQVIPANKEQVYLCFAAPGLPESHPYYYGLQVLLHGLGGGANSRLVKELREDKGLVYHIGAAHYGFRDAGVLMIGAICMPENIMEVTEGVLRVLESVCEKGLGSDTFSLAKDALKGKTLLGLETASEHMAFLGLQVLSHLPARTMEDIEKKIEEVDEKDIARFAHHILAPDLFSTVAYGPIEEDIQKEWKNNFTYRY